MDSSQLVIEIGGNTGRDASVFADLGCTLHVFEPIPSLAKKLVERFTDAPHVRVYNFGLRDVEKEVPIWISGVDGEGASTVHKPNGDFTEEIIQLSKTGSAPEEIIREIRDSQTIYRMDSDDVIELHKAGVNKDVIDYMMETEKKAAERRYRYHYDPYYYGSPHHHYHHHPHYGWWY